MGMDELIKKYRASLKVVRSLQIKADEHDRKLLSGMASDIQYAIEWMQIGHQPGLRRGVERRAAYQREIPIDPIKIQKYYVANVIGHSGSISEFDRQRIDYAMSRLTKLEKEIYLMARGQVLSHSEIASQIGVSVGTVKKVLDRADKKIANEVKINLFCQPNATYI